MTELSSQLLESLDFAASLFREARHTVVLTGAGLSTSSGIPDFRSAGSGLWSRDEPMEVASLLTFRTRPELFFNWFRPLANQIYQAKPNAAHLALAEMEKKGRVQSILTQNIDMLHERAGSKAVLELHGTLRTLSCTRCYQKFDYESYLLPFVENGKIPYCPVCAAVLKPDVILFGEQLPYRVLLDAQVESRKCDLMVVIGSSLEVLPVAGLPMQALDRGAHLIIINNSPTYLDVRADVVLPEDVTTIITAIAARVL